MNLELLWCLFRAKLLNLRTMVSTKKTDESELVPQFLKLFSTREIAFDPNDQQIRIQYTFVEWIKFAWQPQTNMYLHEYWHWIHKSLLSICVAKAMSNYL